MFSFIRTFHPHGGMRARIFWSNIMLFSLSEIFISVMLSRNAFLLQTQNTKTLTNGIIFVVGKRKIMVYNLETLEKEVL